MNIGPMEEERLRETLDALAAQVHAPPDAYRQARNDWRRRERRRRLILAILVAIVFTIADVIGLWALNHSHDGQRVIFNGPVQVEPHSPVPPPGQP
jgi:hypothetical protein